MSSISSAAFSRMPRQKHDMLRRHAIATDDSLREAMAKINSLSGDSMTLFAIDAGGLLQGTITDGDIRRALIAGAELDSPVETAMNHDFQFIAPGDKPYLKIQQCRLKDIDLLPAVDNGYITDILDLRHLHTSLPIDAVLMAGGKGERLRPLTLETPKPLLPIGNKPIIDYNVDELAACGVKNIFVTVNYLKEMIIEHFNSTVHGVPVTCIEEPCRLGTIGSLALIDGLSQDNLLLMNSDILTNMNFEKMFLQHISNDADITIAAVPYTVSIPFAILQTDGIDVIGLSEKPTYNYFANAGVYIIRRELVCHIPRGEYLDAPDFVDMMLQYGKKVQFFHTDATWIDIGSPDDYRYANEMISNAFVK